MEHKAPIKTDGRTIALIIVGIAGLLALGIGMCFCMVWAKFLTGVIIGLVGIIILLSLIPLIKGVK